MAQSPVSTSPSYFDPTPHFALPVAGVFRKPPRLTSKLLLYSLQAELMDIDRPQSDSEVSLASVQQSGAVDGNDKTIRNGKPYTNCHYSFNITFSDDSRARLNILRM